MEKRLPHVPLVRVKDLIREGRYEIKISALRGAALLGLTVEDMIEVILSLTRDDFYKSMTTYADHREWQDVYRPMTLYGGIYLKFTVREGVIVVSFKEA